MPLRKRIAPTESCFFEEPALWKGGRGSGSYNYSEGSYYHKGVQKTNFQPKNSPKKRNFGQ